MQAFNRAEMELALAQLGRSISPLEKGFPPVPVVLSSGWTSESPRAPVWIPGPQATQASDG